MPSDRSPRVQTRTTRMPPSRRMGIFRGQGDGKATCQCAHIPIIVFVWSVIRIAAMLQDLAGSAEASHRLSLDGPMAIQAACWIEHLTGHVGAHRLSCGCDDHRVDVDHAAACVHEHIPVRHPWLCIEVRMKTWKHRCTHGIFMRQHDQIQVIVWSCLDTQKRIDTPSAVNPDRQSRPFQVRQDFTDVISVHHGVSIPVRRSRPVTRRRLGCVSSVVMGFIRHATVPGPRCGCEGTSFDHAKSGDQLPALVVASYRSLPGGLRRLW
jgi:hypothetical protein